MDLGNLAIVDIETTGTNSNRDRVIEIGILRVENGKVVSTWQSLIDPGQYLPIEISNMTGIQQMDLEKASSWRHMSDTIEELLEGCIFVAHNARFDYSFVKREQSRIGKKMLQKQLCTVRLARRLYPEMASHSLGSLIDRFGINFQRRHRALDDALATWEFVKIAQHDKAEQFDDTVKYLLRHQTAAGKIDQERINQLPEKPGVYIFWGNDGAPLYVGKSVNVQDRVKSHLSEAVANSREMKLLQTAEYVEAVECGGELEALIKESQLIKSMQPLYNRMLRKSQDMISVWLDETSHYFSASMGVEKWPRPGCVGMFKSKKAAVDFIRDKAKTHNLCERLLGVETTRKTCFASELGRCKACVGIEDPLKYNLRVSMAFANDKIKQWPFDGPIVVKEQGRANVFDQWCYLGSWDGQGELNSNFEFDLDVYKILLRFFKNPANMAKVHVVRRLGLEPRTLSLKG